MLADSIQSFGSILQQIHQRPEFPDCKEAFNIWGQDETL